jgi:hypothetical protein
MNTDRRIVPEKHVSSVLAEEHIWERTAEIKNTLKESGNKLDNVAHKWIEHGGMNPLARVMMKNVHGVPQKKSQTPVHNALGHEAHHGHDAHGHGHEAHHGHDAHTGMKLIMDTMHTHGHEAHHGHDAHTGMKLIMDTMHTHGHEAHHGHDAHTGMKLITDMMLTDTGMKLITDMMLTRAWSSSRTWAQKWHGQLRQYRPLVWWTRTTYFWLAWSTLGRNSMILCASPCHKYALLTDSNSTTDSSSLLYIINTLGNRIAYFRPLNCWLLDTSNIPWYRTNSRRLRRTWRRSWRMKRARWSLTSLKNTHQLVSFLLIIIEPYLSSSVIHTNHHSYWLE